MLARCRSRLCATATTALVVNEASLSPSSIVKLLDSYIVGQRDAKKAVAVSLRNRWRRKQLVDEGLKGDVVPKNILMVGPTGVGKTEISRRMAKLTDAPFVKVEATKYTEVGFKGKDVESIIEDLYTAAKSKARRKLEKARDAEATTMARDIVFTALQKKMPALTQEEFDQTAETTLKDLQVSIDITISDNEKPRGTNAQLETLFGMEKRKFKTRVTKTVREALDLAKQEAFQKLVDEHQIKVEAKSLAEQEGIVFIDEIDKVVSDASSSTLDPGSLGVQQDLLPLIEGSNVTMKDGTVVATDNVLFICSGAFHNSKPADMIAELQGRLPVRVELKALDESEFRRILVEPKFNLLAQQTALLSTENITLTFTDDGISAIAQVTSQVNTNAQNIGARRLHTVIERVLDEYSFDCDKYEGQTVSINSSKVKASTNEMLKNIDLAKFLL